MRGIVNPLTVNPLTLTPQGMALPPPALAGTASATPPAVAPLGPEASEAGEARREAWREGWREGSFGSGRCAGPPAQPRAIAVIIL